MRKFSEKSTYQTAILGIFLSESSAQHAKPKKNRQHEIDADMVYYILILGRNHVSHIAYYPGPTGEFTGPYVGIPT